MSASLVVAAYNAEGYIRRAIDSILDQQPAFDEIIVVNDGSSDATSEVVRSFGARVRLICQVNSGPGAARNRGAHEARGELVAFLDADDQLLPGMLGRLSNALRLHPRAAVASGAFYVERDGVRRRVPLPGLVLGRRQIGTVDRFFEVARRQQFVCVGAALIRRAAFLDVGGFREDCRFGEDLDLWARLAAKHEWVFLDEVVMTYHHNPASSATLRTPEAEKPVEFLMDEARMQTTIPPEVRVSYRRYRRDVLVRQARAALHQGAVSQASRLLEAIPPADMSVEWVATGLLVRVPGLALWVLRALRVVRNILNRRSFRESS